MQSETRPGGNKYGHAQDRRNLLPLCKLPLHGHKRIAASQLSCSAVFCRIGVGGHDPLELQDPRLPRGHARSEDEVTVPSGRGVYPLGKGALRARHARYLSTRAAMRSTAATLAAWSWEKFSLMLSPACGLNSVPAVTITSAC